ncbi:hypothetical protein NKH18_15250 [Streptomyces sp. M10(2022)]
MEKNVGRLFFTFSDGYDGSCTATVVTSANRSTVITAAHCLRDVGAPSDDDTWNHNFYFVPGYRNGTKPLGGFSLRTMATSSRWDADPDTTEPSDVAAAGYDTGLLVANPAAGDNRSRTSPEASASGSGSPSRASSSMPSDTRSTDSTTPGTGMSDPA